MKRKPAKTPKKTPKPAVKAKAKATPAAKTAARKKSAANAKKLAAKKPEANAKVKTITRSSNLKGTTPIDPKQKALARILETHPGARDTEGSSMLPSLELDGHLDVNSSLFVVGDVKVTGAIRIGEMCSLFVGGNVSCANFFAEGDFQCNELHVVDTLYGNYEAGMTMAHKATGKLWLAGSHDFEFEEDDFEDKHDLSEYKPGEEPKALPAGHKLSRTAVKLLIARPQADWEGKGSVVSGEEWWKLLVAGGASS